VVDLSGRRARHELGLVAQKLANPHAQMSTGGVAIALINPRSTEDEIIRALQQEPTRLCPRPSLRLGALLPRSVHQFPCWTPRRTTVG
jgi:hypothetical protein